LVSGADYLSLKSSVGLIAEDGYDLMFDESNEEFFIC
jgi:hypothetical protein